MGVAGVRDRALTLARTARRGRAHLARSLHATVLTPFARLLGSRCVRPRAAAMVFGQVVIGPPGSGKTTYCVGMQQYLEALGRKVAVVNLDPANENYTYPVAADIHDLIDLDAAAAHCELGPNGALVYCFEYSEATV